MATTDYSLERGLPSSMDAERSILGAILLDNNAYFQASQKLRADDLSVDSHRRIFARIIEMMEANRSVDIITLSEELRTQQQLEAVGGVAYLASLTDGVPPRPNIEHYVKIVKDKSLLRGLINLSNLSISRALEQSEAVESILGEAEQGLMKLSEDAIQTGFVDVNQIVQEKFGSIDALVNRGHGVSGLSTHYADLDEKLNGLQPSDLIIVAARPSMGKTAFAMNIAENAAVMGGKTVAIFSLEMSAESLLQRMVCSHARVDSHRMRTGFLDRGDRQRVMEAVGRLMETKLFIDDTPGISLLQMRAKARRLKQSVGSLDLVVVDYLQLMSSDVIGNKRYENRNQEVSAISRGLKLLAKELHVPVVALSQLSRAPEARTGDHKPQLSDLRESGSIEQDADVVAFIFRPEVYEKDDSKKAELDGQAQIIIAKQRNGPTGTVHMVFLKKFTRFEQAMGGDNFEAGE
ncbi:MAG TPA: replicative DNA helicase [Terriglobales bacterium]|nr:replicative DNA helicase [Terriglobales bacterium]